MKGGIMGVSQISQSFQDDGNFSQLDLRDIASGGPIARIETFRCSQSAGETGRSAAGSPVVAIAGADHLTPESNHVFRHVFSAGDINGPKLLLEIREQFEADGSFEVRTRDVDGESSSFGLTLINVVTPVEGGVDVKYELRRPASKRMVLTSPVTRPVGELTGLPEIALSADELGEVREVCKQRIALTDENSKALRAIDEFGASLRAQAPEWSRNVVAYERFGDFRDKCVHDGTNLSGPRKALASEYLLIRAYRVSLITLGRVFDPSMGAGAQSLKADDPLSLDTKPGVYSVFLSAYALNISLYQLGLDKVHSDYGGVPMRRAPGSRLEGNAQEPIIDATNLNRLLAALAAAYYAPATLPLVARGVPSIVNPHYS